MHDLVGGRYRLDEHIGNGGMAEVWRATDNRTGETVAVKRLHPRLAHDTTSRARFAREVEAARAVDHPSAVRVLDAGDGDDGGWLAMDYLSGGSLSDRLRAGPMPAESVATIGADIAGALAAVHAAGLVHRDVKPSNILLDQDGRARLGDFGIARGDAIDGLEDVTATGDVVGTLRFLPPEALAGGPAAASSDVWALGAVMYEALTGRPPFDSSSPAALVASQ
jgi:eukaryotic-like serine/threonine-protein kinase